MRSKKMSVHGCQHLQAYKAVSGTKTFKVIYSYFVAASNIDSKTSGPFKKVWKKIN